MRVVLRPARREDFSALRIDKLPHRIKALTAVDPTDGTVLGVGGLVFIDGAAWASVVMTEAGRRYKVALYRAARTMLAQAAAEGVRVVHAQPEPGRAGAVKLLERLGFTRLAGSDTFVWRARCGTIAIAARG